MEENLELLDKVIVEEAVEERVATGRRHAKHVEEGESYHQIFCVVEQVKQFGEDAENTERQPTGQ